MVWGEVGTFISDLIVYGRATIYRKRMLSWLLGRWGRIWTWEVLGSLGISGDHCAEWWDLEIWTMGRFSSALLSVEVSYSSNMFKRTTPIGIRLYMSQLYYAQTVCYTTGKGHWNIWWDINLQYRHGWVVCAWFNMGEGLLTCDGEVLMVLLGVKLIFRWFGISSSKGWVRWIVVSAF